METVKGNASQSLLLVGAGQMAIDYINVLKFAGIVPLVFGRGAASAAKFENATGIRVGIGSLDGQIARAAERLPKTAIVAVNAHQLTEASINLIQSGVTKLLIEKPAALDLDEVCRLQHAAQRCGAEVFVAYNRRFLASVQAAQEIVAADGGALSVKFDFSEPARRIVTLGKPERELKTWFYGNCTHVLDLAFHFAGQPARLSGDVSGGSVIDPDSGIFAGHGRSTNGCHVSWHANWVAPGRWGVEVLTREHRLILQPLEKLRLQTHAGFAEIEQELDDGDDRAFKPGLLRQTLAFLADEETDKRLLTLHGHAKMMLAYEAIRTGSAWIADLEP